MNTGILLNATQGIMSNYRVFKDMLETFTLSAIPIMARGKPYVNIIADHSDPGRILKYAPKPYLLVTK